MRGGKGQCSRNEDLARRSPTVCTPNSAQRSRSNEPQLKAFKRISATLCFQPSKAPPSGSRLALREGGTGPARPFQRCEHGEWQPKGHQWPALGGRDKETSESFSTRQGTCGPSGTTCWRVTPICLEEVMLQHCKRHPQLLGQKYKWKQRSETQDMFQKGGLQGINSPFEESWINSVKRLMVRTFGMILPSSQIWVTFVCSFVLQRSMETFIFYK
nr:uncharacterized protein LOC110364947 isoform X1 [Columba livia]